MKIKDFEKELLKSLERPEEWEIQDARLVHKESGVSMLTSQIVAGSRCAWTLVCSPEGDHLTWVNPQEAEPCLKAAQEQGQKTREQVEQGKRLSFFRRFKGFK